MNPDKVHKANSLKDAVQNCDLIIEAVVEDIDIKSNLFREIGELASPDTIFASNTSSLDIEQMAKASGRPDRFLGLHFFNPAYLMRLVEVVKPKQVSSNVFSSVMDFLNIIKKSGILCKPSPGFIVNRLMIPTLNEAFFILDKISNEKTRIEIANDIDSAITKNQVFLMGLFDLTDLTGLDTALAVAERIFNGFNKTPKYTPSPLLKSYVEKGYTGRKTLRGVYYYANSENDPDANPRCEESGRVLNSVPAPQFDIVPLISVIVNESFRILEEGIAEKYDDIDFCMQSGAHWPMGPFELAKKFGIALIRDTIQNLYHESNNNPRYEPSEFLLNPPREVQEFLDT